MWLRQDSDRNHTLELSCRGCCPEKAAEPKSAEYPFPVVELRLLQFSGLDGPASLGEMGQPVAHCSQLCHQTADLRFAPLSEIPELPADISNLEPLRCRDLQRRPVRATGLLVRQTHL